MTSRHGPGPAPVEVLGELLDEGEARSVPDRPRPSDRPARRRPAPPPPAVVVRAIAGAAVSVCAVALGLVVLLWLDQAPESVSAASGPAAATAPTPTGTPAPGPPPPVAPGPTVAPPTVAPPTVAVAPLVVPVTVLNNSRRSKLAARGAERFAAGGWPVAAVGNFRGRIPVTTVYYDPGLEPSAQAFAARFEGVVRVRPRFDGLPARGVVVVLTREFAV